MNQIFVNYWKHSFVGVAMRIFGVKTLDKCILLRIFPETN